VEGKKEITSKGKKKGNPYCIVYEPVRIFWSIWNQDSVFLPGQIAFTCYNRSIMFNFFFEGVHTIKCKAYCPESRDNPAERPSDQ
jgi:hypothetical protein